MENKVLIKTDCELIIGDQDFIEADLQAGHQLTLTIRTQPGSSGVAVINICQAAKLTINTEVSRDSRLTVLYWNTAANLDVTEQVTLQEHAVYKVAYGELETGILNRKADIELAGRCAQAELVSAALVSAKKHMDLTCHHQAKDTIANMQTYGVIQTGGEYYVKATGHIVKHASGSKSHQTSRALTFADQQRVDIIPLLLIDENDVEASHAMSIGQLDENQLYYLESRGLTKNDALRLIALGYLLPIAKVIDNEQLKSYLEEIINKKVQETCLM